MKKILPLLILITSFKLHSQTFEIPSIKFPFYKIIEWKGIGAIALGRDPSLSQRQVDLVMVSSEGKSTWQQVYNPIVKDPYFIAEDGVYIGTDKHERWTKTEFITFAKPYFDKGKAWSFVARDRDLHVTSDGKNAWFSELLAAWMGVGRGSGVLAMEDNRWRLKQYHLSVTVPNDLIRDFISLVENFERKGKP